jgi:Ca-activated chloride channel homolog
MDVPAMDVPTMDVPAMHVNARLDRALARTRWTTSRYALLELRAPARASVRPRPPLNLALVLDRSGSMAGAKLDLARRAAVQLVRGLDDRDRACVVAYDDEVCVIAPSRPTTAAVRADVEGRIRAIGSGGSTNLSGGWLEGCREVAEAQADGADAIDRALLLTDGLANVGIVDQEELCTHAAELRRRGITTSTFGIGADYNEDLLQALAEKGGGHYFYLRDAGDVAPSFAQELGELMATVARDVVVEVRAPGATLELLNDQPVERLADGLRVRLGDLCSREEKALLLKVTTAPGDAETEAPISAHLTYRDADDGRGRELAFPAVAVRRARDREVDAQPRDPAVQRATGLLYAARAKKEAADLNRAGRYDRARRVLERTAERIASYAGDDEELLAAIRELRAEAPRWAAPMAAPAMKEAKWASYRRQQSRPEYRR